MQDRNRSADSQMTVGDARRVGQAVFCRSPAYQRRGDSPPIIGTVGVVETKAMASVIVPRLAGLNESVNASGLHWHRRSAHGERHELAMGTVRITVADKGWEDR